MLKKPIVRESLSIAAVTLVLALIIAFARGLTSCADLKSVLFVLGDSFFLAGVAMGTIGAFNLLVGTGSFDALGYSLRKLGGKRKEDTEEVPEGFGAYREAQEKKRSERTKHPAVAFVGLGFLLFGMALSLIYMAMK